MKQKIESKIKNGCSLGNDSILDFYKILFLRPFMRSSRKKTELKKLLMDIVAKSDIHESYQQNEEYVDGLLKLIINYKKQLSVIL